MKKIVEKHPLAIRWFHWINFPVLTVMIWSGMLIYWANDVYKVHLGKTIYFQFFPEAFYKKMHFSYRLAEGMAFHFVFMWLFFLNGLLYVTYTIFSGEWRYLVPDKHSFREAWLTVLHDLHIRKTAPPQLKYNGAQKIAYTSIIIMGLGSLLTGLAIYKPVQFSWITWCFGGYGSARVIHFILTLGYCLFFVIHIVQVILAGWNNFRAMVAGFELVNLPNASTPVVAALSNPDPALVFGPPSLPIAAASMPSVLLASTPETPAPAYTDPTPIPASPTKRQRVPLNPHQQSRRRTLVSFAGLTLFGLGAGKLWFLIKDHEKQQGVQEPLRRGLHADEGLFKHALSPAHLAPVFPRSAAAVNVRSNGDVGLGTQDFDPAAWTLNVTTADGRLLSIGIDELKQLPKTEFIFEFKCIEGWSQVSWWGGVRFSDFVNHYQLHAETAKQYVGLSTPDKAYYVGIDTASALHPQTLLCYEMNGQPLPARHGQPLRLIIPVKYGVKNLKRISNIYFSDQRPPDYWYERGYDYFCGL